MQRRQNNEELCVCVCVCVMICQQALGLPNPCAWHVKGNRILLRLTWKLKCEEDVRSPNSQMLKAVGSLLLSTITNKSSNN